MLQYRVDNLDAIGDMLSPERRILLFGEPGIGKSTLAKQLLQHYHRAGKPCCCLNADPGTPAFGIPGALCLAEWKAQHWLARHHEPLCSLDAGRFRLPLVGLVQRLVTRLPTGAVIIDTPGLVRGVASAELLLALIAAARIDLVFVLLREGESPPLADELQSCHIRCVSLLANAEARRPSKVQRAQQRSQMWQAYMAQAKDYDLPAAAFQLLGTPPPLAATEAWSGKQVALLHDDKLITMGEVTAIDDAVLQLRLASEPGMANRLLIRDAIVSEGMLHTAKPRTSRMTATTPPSASLSYVVPKALSPLSKVELSDNSLVTRVGSVNATLVNGVLGDPLLHLQLRYQRRSLLFDLGDAGRMSARTAHQVSDIFITHTHADHIGGFMWFLRSRIGHFPPCRCYGPPGLAQQIAGMVSGIMWDRVEDRAPRFEVGELHGDHLRRWLVTAGRDGPQSLETLPVEDGVLLREPSFCVRATTLDHGIPVLAYAFEPAVQIKVRKERLTAQGLNAGRWLQRLKQQYLQGRMDAQISLPDGSLRSVSSLADDLLLLDEGKKLAYATDFSDTADNRERLVALAKGAHTFFCESSFLIADKNRAINTQHLTTTACGEIATAARVLHLVPFHFSRRYEHKLETVYRELHDACPHTVQPLVFESSQAHMDTLFQ